MIQITLLIGMLSFHPILYQDRDMNCATYFCQGTVRQLELMHNCTSLMSGSENCRCYPASKSEPYTYCETVGESALPIIAMETRLNATGPVKNSLMIIYLHRSPREQEVLNDKFLTYLPMTNITTFAVWTQGGCKGGIDTQSYVTILKLLRSYPETQVEALVLESNCIGRIEGQFSSSFPYLRKLKLAENYLQLIHPGTFQNLIHLKWLDLSQNNLLSLNNEHIFHGLTSLILLNLAFIGPTDFHPRLLTSLVHLQFLNLSHSRPKSVPPEVEQNTELELLDLSNCDLNSSYLTRTRFRKLAKLQKLNLNNNNMETIPADVFHPRAVFEYLFLANNYIKALSFVKSILHVFVFDMSGNCLYEKNSTMSSLQIPTTSRKHIASFTCDNCCLNTETAGQLAEMAEGGVQLKGNNIQVIDMTFLKRVAHLTLVILSPTVANSRYEKRSSNAISKELKIKLAIDDPLYVTSAQHEETEIQLLNYEFSTCEFFTLMMVNGNLIKSHQPELTRSKLHFYVNNYTVDGRTYLEKDAYLNNVSLLTTVCQYNFYCPSPCVCSTKGYTDIITVNCSNRNLTSFPDTEGIKNHLILQLNSNQIKRLEKTDSLDWGIYSEVYLNHNLIYTLENFNVTPNLRILDLRNNRLKEFSSLHRVFREDSQTSFWLSGNPWQCDCKTEEMKNILITRNITDFKQITCTSMHSGRSILLVNATEADFCPPDELPKMLLTILLPVLGSFVVVIILGIVTFYRSKEFIKLWLFTHGLCLRFVDEDDMDADKLYDAFISYSSLDEEWVANNLVHRLEHEPPTHKLCLHGRDWLAGVWIMQQIIWSVKNSRRTIIILTDNFLNSHWSRVEFMVAYKQAIADHINRVLIVVPGEVPELDMLGVELRTFVILHTYLKWEDLHFWRKLRCAMKPVKEQPGQPQQEVRQLPEPHLQEMRQLIELHERQVRAPEPHEQNTTYV